LKTFNAQAHDRHGFVCRVLALDPYLSQFAEQHRRCGISSVYVLTDAARPEHILGYYALSAAEVDMQRLSEAERNKLPRFPVPCFRMGRLACRSDEQGRGPGKLLLGCAVDRCLKAKQQVAANALLADAKDDAAKAFYAYFGFKTLSDATLTRCSGAGTRTLCSISSVRSAALARLMERCGNSPSTLCSPTVKAGFNDDIGS
jgi:predicted GNAT family N-acyltransferase